MNLTPALEAAILAQVQDYLDSAAGKYVDTIAAFHAWEEGDPYDPALLAQSRIDYEAAVAISDAVREAWGSGSHSVDFTDSREVRYAFSRGDVRDDPKPLRVTVDRTTLEVTTGA